MLSSYDDRAVGLSPIQSGEADVFDEGCPGEVRWTVREGSPAACASSTIPFQQAKKNTSGDLRATISCTSPSRDHCETQLVSDARPAFSPLTKGGGAATRASSPSLRSAPCDRVWNTHGQVRSARCCGRRMASTCRAGTFREWKDRHSLTTVLERNRACGAGFRASSRGAHGLHQTRWW